MKHIVLIAIVLFLATGCVAANKNSPRPTQPVREEPSGIYIASEEHLAMTYPRLEISGGGPEGFRIDGFCIGKACEQVAKKKPERTAKPAPPRGQIVKTTGELEGMEVNIPFALPDIPPAENHDVGEGGYQPPEPDARELKRFERE